MRFIRLLLISLILYGCTKEKTPKSTPLEDSAQYQLEVLFDWTASRHPSALGPFPAGAHFSPLIGSIHQENHSFFSKGSTASQGMESMAETGATAILAREIQEQIDAGVALHLLQANGGTSAQETKSLDVLSADGDHAFLTIVSMIAPSPDWFVAVQNLPLKDPLGNWLETIEAPLVSLDAGTDSGHQFTAPNEDTQPKETIEAFVTENSISLGRIRLTKE